MTLTLTIENETSLPNGAPVSVKVTDKRNLDIGRGAHLDWTLPDPSRFISGKHCEVRYRDGAYWLYDVSTNGTFLNDNTRRIQTPHKLDDGDRLAIGSYIIRVSIEDEEQKSTEAAAVEAEVPVDAALTAPAVTPASEAEALEVAALEAATAEAAKLSEESITAKSESAAAKPESAAAKPESADFWSDLIAADLGLKEDASPAASTPAMPQLGASRLYARGSIAEALSETAEPETKPFKDTTFDAWSETDTTEAPASSHEGGESSGGGKAIFEASSILDKIDAAGESPVQSLPKADAFPFNQLDPDHGKYPPDPASVPSFGQEAARFINEPVRSPAEKPEEKVEEEPEQTLLPHELPRVADVPMFETPRAKTQPPISQPPVSQPPVSQPAAQRVQQQPVAEAPAAASPDGEVTLDAFLERFAAAAGIPAQLFDKRDKLKAADDLGFMMHHVVSSLRQLLSARDSAKRFARTSSRTVVQAFDNNPLKFAPTPEDALKIMFGPKTSGYLDARRTLESAFEDLKAHQIKTFSAMQGAVKMLVEDLDPEELDAALGEEHGLAALLSSRKSKLWDLYLARWQAKTLRHEDGLADAFMFYFAECYDRAND